MQYVIIGHSAAGVFAAEAIREQDAQAKIIMLTSETDSPYCKCLAFHLLEGESNIKLMQLRPQEWASQTGVQLKLQAEVAKVQGLDRKVVLTTGETITFDRLLIATGARPKPLNIPGGNLPEVMSLRTAWDVRSIREKAKKDGLAVVYGGGLISLKSALSLHKLGLEVTIIIPAEEHWSQMLDNETTGMVKEKLTQTGIKFCLGRNIQEIEGSAETGVTGIILEDGTKLTANLVIVGTGVQPNCELINPSEISCGNGLKVNEFMQTNIPYIYGAGDVVETRDLILGITRINPMWTAATQQGRIAGLNMAGRRLSYPGTLPMNSVDFDGLSIMSAGVIRPIQGMDLETHVSFRPGSYSKLTFRGECLVGYILAEDTFAHGFKAPGGILTNLIYQQTSCRTQLLAIFPKVHQFTRLLCSF